MRKNTLQIRALALIFAVRLKKSIMANHKSAEKRIRANETKRLRNRYQAKTTRTQVKKLVATTKKDEGAGSIKRGFCYDR
jgi:hypothetical protein